MNDPMIVVPIVGIILVCWWLRHTLQFDQATKRRVIEESERREAEAAYHAQLAGKYAATMTDEDRDWYASLPDWDRLPIFRSGK